MRLTPLAALLAVLGCATIQAPPVEAKDMRLTISPRVALSGGAVWITCYVPEEIGSGIIRYGLERVRMSGPEQLVRIQHQLLVEFVPCGDWLASCTVVTIEQAVIRREEMLQVRGIGCDDAAAIH